jgi:hypothetical protein
MCATSAGSLAVTVAGIRRDSLDGHAGARRPRARRRWRGPRIARRTSSSKVRMVDQFHPVGNML